MPESGSYGIPYAIRIAPETSPSVASAASALLIPQILTSMLMGRGLSPARHKEATLVVKRRYPASSAAIALAAATGSGAAKMGRPTTRMSAPALAASSGVITRR